MYKDNEYQFVAVFDKKAETWEKSNALGHMATGFADAHLSESDDIFCNYRNNNTRANISRFPFIVLEGSATKLLELHNFIQSNNLPYNVFSRHMFGGSADEQMASFANAEDRQLIGLMTFGETAKIKAATKRFSLFK